jgi:two-component system NtrC family sensor kinase
MKKSVTTLILITSILLAHAQRKNIDSLRKLLAGSKQDTSRAILLAKMGAAYERIKPDSAILLGQQALQLSRALHFFKGEQRAQTVLGGAFVGMGNYPKALTAYLEVLKATESIHDAEQAAKTLVNIANIYSDEGDERQSIKFTLRGLAAARSAHNSRSIAVALGNLGDSYEKLNKLDSALLYMMQGYHADKKLHNISLLEVSLNNLGNVYRKMHRPDSALYYYRQAIILHRQTEDNDAWAETTIGMAKVFKTLKLQDSSLYYARQSMTLGQRGGFTARVLDASTFLTEYFKDAGRLDSAFVYQQVLLAAKDSLFSQEKTKEVQDLTFSERQRQLDIQERDASYRANIRFYLLLALVLFLIILAFVFWRNNRKNEKAKKLLEQQKEQIQTTLGELKSTQNQLIQSAKMASLGELTAGIAHEIQNPLNFVNNFSEVNREMIFELKQELNEGNIAEAMAIANDIESNEGKISHHGKRADFIVKGMLEHSRSGSGEKQATNINTLTDEFLKLSYHGLRAKDKNFNANLVTSFAPQLPKIEVVQQDIGRVLINLFSNAFYAVRERAKEGEVDFKPEVSVRTFVENGSLIISVKDNGQGVSEEIKHKIMQPFFTTKPAGEGTGLGLSLSYDIIVKGHGGKLEVNSVAGEYSEFIIKLPVK